MSTEKLLLWADREKNFVSRSSPLSADGSELLFRSFDFILEWSQRPPILETWQAIRFSWQPWFYKRGCQEKNFSSERDREKNFVSRSSPLSADGSELLFRSFDFILEWSQRPPILETWQAIRFSWQPWFYPRLVAYRYFWFSEGA